MEMWSLPLESNLSEPWLIGGVRQALLNRLLLSACFVNGFARLAEIWMENRGPEKQNPLRAKQAGLMESSGHPGRHTSPDADVEH